MLYLLLSKCNCVVRPWSLAFPIRTNNNVNACHIISMSLCTDVSYQVSSYQTTFQHMVRQRTSIQEREEIHQTQNGHESQVNLAPEFLLLLFRQCRGWRQRSLATEIVDHLNRAVLGVFDKLASLSILFQRGLSRRRGRIFLRRHERREIKWEDWL